MKTTYRGRIIEIGETQNSDKPQAWIELFSESVSEIFKLPAELNTKDLALGQLVALQTNQQGTVVSIERLGRKPFQWDPLSDCLRWRRPIGKKSRMIKLRQRQEILSEIRRFLHDLNFLEVETPLMVKGTCPDSNIESIPSGSRATGDESYLVTSTEYQIKRMIVGGFEKLFTLTKNFRANDRGRYHASEFTMIEWARAYGNLDEIEKDAEGFIKRAFAALYPRHNYLEFQGERVDMMQSTWERITVREAFEKYLGVTGLVDFSLPTLLTAAQNAGIAIPENFRESQDFVLSFLLDRLQPYLGRETPTFLREWPAFMISSGELNHSGPTVCERSELYICGIEIADGFPFLTDAQRQKENFQRELAHRKHYGQNTVTLDEKYIEALEQGIPPGAGMALGVDRLVMVLTQSDSLAEVQAFHWDEI